MYLNHQYHLEQKDPNIARYDGFTINVQNQITAKKPFKNYPFPIWINMGFRQQYMNNKLNGDLTYDNKNYFISVGNQFKFYQIKPSIEFRYEVFQNFTTLNNQENYSLISIVPLKFINNNSLYFNTELKLNNYTNTEKLSNIQLSGSMNYRLNLTPKSVLSSRGFIAITDTKAMIDERGYEITLSPQVDYKFYYSSNINFGLNYRFEKKISKDEETFSYNQHIIGLSFGANYE